MRGSLDSAWLKIQRAKEHIQQLKAIVEEFRLVHTREIVFKYDAQSGKHMADVWVPDPPPLRLAVIVGDIAHNLRSALDHAAYQLELMVGRTPDRHTGFPIYWERAKFQDAVKRGIPQRFPKRAWALIQQLQPYRRGQRYRTHPLFQLHEVNRRDKHQLLTVTCTLLPFPKLRGFHKYPNGKLVETVPGAANPGPVHYGFARLKPGTVRFTLDHPSKTSDVYVEAKVTFEIGLDESDFKYRGPLIQFVYHLRDGTSFVLFRLAKGYPTLRGRPSHLPPSTV
jgi:hypothetical protein